MHDMHPGAFKLTLTAENWSSLITVRSAIDGRVVNGGVKLYRKHNGKHLQPQTVAPPPIVTAVSNASRTNRHTSVV